MISVSIKLWQEICFGECEITNDLDHAADSSELNSNCPVWVDLLCEYVKRSAQTAPMRRLIGGYTKTWLLETVTSFIICHYYENNNNYGQSNSSAFKWTGMEVSNRCKWVQSQVYLLGWKSSKFSALDSQIMCSPCVLYITFSAISTVALFLHFCGSYNTTLVKASYKYSVSNKCLSMLVYPIRLYEEQKFKCAKQKVMEKPVSYTTSL